MVQGQVRHHERQVRLLAWLNQIPQLMSRTVGPNQHEPRSCLLPCCAGVDSHPIMPFLHSPRTWLSRQERNQLEYDRFRVKLAETVGLDEEMAVIVYPAISVIDVPCVGIA